MTRMTVGKLDGREFAVEKGKLFCIKCEKAFADKEKFIKHSCTTRTAPTTAFRVATESAPAATDIEKGDK